MTTGSKNLLTDVAHGGYKKDLSLLFENATLPVEYANRHIYSDGDVPVVPAPTRFAGAEPMPSPDPKWSLLQSHYDMYKKVSSTDNTYSILASNVERKSGTNFFDQQQILPVVSNAQFIFSLSTAFENNEPGYVGFLHLMIDPVITLWNPYNVELRFPKMELEFYRFPLDIKFMINGVNRAKGDGFVNIANMYNAANGGGWGAQDSKPYRARIHPDVDGDDIVLKPGEYKVFSPTTFQRHHAHWQYTNGVILKEGWDPYGGGVGSRYLMATDDGAWAGETGGAWITLKATDVVTLDVRARKVNRVGTGFLETNNEEISAYLKVFQGDGGVQPLAPDMKDKLDQNRTQVGAIELDLSGGAMAANLPSISATELPTYRPDRVTTHSDPHKGKEPFLNASLRLKTEGDSNTITNTPNSSIWLHNGLTNPYSTFGIVGDQSELEKSHQYELTWTPMTTWNDIPGVEVDANNRGYGGTGVTSGSGVNFAPYHQIPLAPYTSLAQFSHAPLNSGGQAPLTSQIVGNSFASPSLPLKFKSITGSLGKHIDHSYMANTSLFDSYFLSTATAQTQAIYGASSRPLTTVLNEFFEFNKPLPNRNFKPATTISPTVTAADYDTFAQHLYNKGAFNGHQAIRTRFAH